MILRDLVLALLLSACAASAQEVAGSISGQVLDPGGAAIAGAQVTVTHRATGDRFALKLTF